MPSTRQACRMVCPSSAWTCCPLMVTLMARVPGTMGQTGAYSSDRSTPAPLPLPFPLPLVAKLIGPSMLASCRCRRSDAGQRAQHRVQADAGMDPGQAFAALRVGAVLIREALQGGEHRSWRPRLQLAERGVRHL